jgi:hypothetical protein
MVVMTVMVVLAFVVAVAMLLMVAGRVVGAVRGQCRAGAAERQDQGRAGCGCGSLQHSWRPLRASAHVSGGGGFG